MRLTYETKYSWMDQVKFVKAFKKIYLVHSRIAWPIWALNKAFPPVTKQNMKFSTNISLEDVAKSTNPRFPTEKVFGWLSTICDGLRICYHFYNLKNMKNTHIGLLLLVKLQALVCNFTKNNTPPWVFCTFFK